MILEIVRGPTEYRCPSAELFAASIISQNVQNMLTFNLSLIFQLLGGEERSMGGAQSRLYNKYDEIMIFILMAELWLNYWWQLIEHRAAAYNEDSGAPQISTFRPWPVFSLMYY